MIICPNCDRENEDHYKFCLGCGTELSGSARIPSPTTQKDAAPTAAPRARPVATALPKPTPAAPSVIDTAAVPAVVVKARAQAAHQAAAPNSPLPDPTPAPKVAPAVTALPEAVELDSDALPPSPGTDQDESPFDGDLFDLPEDFEATGGDTVTNDDEPEARPCEQCGAMVPEGFRFCGVCGARVEPQQQGGVAHAAPAPATTPVMARLVVIRPDGSQGDVFPLDQGEITVGRAHPSLIFSQDPFLSPQHATFCSSPDGLSIRDEGSLNGVFVRLKSEVKLRHEDQFRIGQELFLFEEMSKVMPILPGAGDGTTVLGSPLRGAWGRISALVAVDTTAGVWTLHQEEEILGRERGDIIFPEDGFISGTHCRLSWREEAPWLLDLGSSNGTYLRVRAPHRLSGGDLILLGQQLFKVEIDA